MESELETSMSNLSVKDENPWIISFIDLREFWKAVIRILPPVDIMKMMILCKDIRQALLDISELLYCTFVERLLNTPAVGENINQRSNVTTALRILFENPVLILHRFPEAIPENWHSVQLEFDIYRYFSNPKHAKLFLTAYCRAYPGGISEFIKEIINGPFVGYLPLEAVKANVEWLIFFALLFRNHGLFAWAFPVLMRQYRLSKKIDGGIFCSILLQICDPEYLPEFKKHVKSHTKFIQKNYSDFWQLISAEIK